MRIEGRQGAEPSGDDNTAPGGGEARGRSAIPSIPDAAQLPHAAAPSLQRPPSPLLADQTAGCARSGTLARPFVRATRARDATRLHHQRAASSPSPLDPAASECTTRAASPSTRLALGCASFDSSGSRSAPVPSAKSTVSKASLCWVLPGAQRLRSARPPRRAASGARARYVTSSVVTRTSTLTASRLVPDSASSSCPCRLEKASLLQPVRRQGCF